MNWNQLQYVLTIAQEKNITKAAQKPISPSLALHEHEVAGTGAWNRSV